MTSLCVFCGSSTRVAERYRHAAEELGGEDVPRTLAIRSNLAVALGLQGHFAESLALHRRVFEARIDVLGGKNPLTLNSALRTAWMLRLLGNYRENNEDAIEVKKFPDLVVCIVADGMGGQAAGEIASQRAIEVVPRELRRQLGQAQTADQTRGVLRKAVVQANEEIMAMGQLDRDLRNMGTTIVMAMWRKGVAIGAFAVGTFGLGFTLGGLVFGRRARKA